VDKSVEYYNELNEMLDKGIVSTKKYKKRLKIFNWIWSAGSGWYVYWLVKYWFKFFEGDQKLWLALVVTAGLIYFLYNFIKGLHLVKQADVMIDDIENTKYNLEVAVEVQTKPEIN